MKLVSGLLTLSLCFASALAAPVPHTVIAGETLYRIAVNAGLKPDAVMAFNNLSSSTLQVGQVLLLPDAAAAARLPAAQVISASVAPPVFRSSKLERGLFVLGQLPRSSAVIRSTSTAAARPSSVYLSGVGFEHQSFNNCGPAAIAAALRQYGVSASQSTWQEQLRPGGQLMSLAAAQTLLRQIGFQATAYRSGTIDALKAQLAAGHPVIVLQFYSQLGKTPHFRVVRGYDDAQGILIMSDSLIGANVALTERDFDLLWNTQGRQYIPIVPA